MKDKLIQGLRVIYKLKDKIAFYPSIIGLLGCFVAYLAFYLEALGISKQLLEIVPNLSINNTETARALLTTFIAGLISIMVLSFSMVMILLSQASSNFSPRLLPGLISNTRHQIVLGIYLATIIYCIFILVSIEPNSNKYQLPSFSIYLAIFFMLNCLAAFIYFIHSISQEIQINNIMEKIFTISKKRIEALIEDEDTKNKTFSSTDKWKSYSTKTSGYLQNVALDDIAKIAGSKDIKIEVLPVKGKFMLENETLFKASKTLTDEQSDTILRHFEFAKNEMIEDNYVLAFKQLTEIALKAMSPGVNDPGTALNAIDYLTQLFSIRMNKKDTTYCKIDNDIKVSMSTVTFKDLMFQVMAALRTYCKHDVIIVKRLLSMLYKLKQACKNEAYINVINTEIEELKKDAKNTIKNNRDLEFLSIT